MDELSEITQKNFQHNFFLVIKMPIQTSISGLNFIFFDDIPEESMKIKDMYDNITFSDNQ